MFSGANLPRVGTYNVNVVLSVVQASEGTSRVEIAQQTGLTAQTVSVIVRRLIQQGIVEESGSRPSGAGKPRKTLRINPAAAYALGIHFDPLRVSIVVVDMNGRPLARSQQDISPGLDPDALIAQAARRRPVPAPGPGHTAPAGARRRCRLPRPDRPETGAGHLPAPA